LAGLLRQWEATTVLIGAYRDGTGAYGTDGYEVGAAYLFTLEPFTPGLSVTHSGGSVIVSWPKTADSFVLDETLALAPPPAASVWSQVPTATYQSNAMSTFITLPAPTGSKFFRLRKP
jgi:hypothetical protein